MPGEKLQLQGDGLRHCTVECVMGLITDTENTSENATLLATPHRYYGTRHRMPLRRQAER